MNAVGNVEPAFRRRWWVWAALGLALVVLLALGATRKPPSGVSDDRLVAVAGNLKCLQCVGESVAGSQAPIAIQMRAEIERQARQGSTDDEIYTWFVDRYGQRVLLNPPAAGVGALIWVLPVVLSFVGAGVVAASIGRWRRTNGVTDGPANDADEALVEALRRTAADRHGSQ